MAVRELTELGKNEVACNIVYDRQFLCKLVSQRRPLPLWYDYERTERVVGKIKFLEVLCMVDGFFLKTYKADKSW